MKGEHGEENRELFVNFRCHQLKIHVPYFATLTFTGSFF